MTNAHLPPFPLGDGVVEKAQGLFDDRAAAVVSAVVALSGSDGYGPVRIWPSVPWLPFQIGGESASILFPKDPWFWSRDLLQLMFYGDAAPTIYVPTAKCLSALAYNDFFGEPGIGLRTMVSAALLAASPGWCGTFGPDVIDTEDVLGDHLEGNYDMSEMYLIAMAYAYYDQLSAEAAEWLITELLARGTDRRPLQDDTHTSGMPPDDWGSAGHVTPLAVGPFEPFHVTIPETENHIFMIETARYLTNQLLFQRDRYLDNSIRQDRQNAHDNRRNGNTAIVLNLLRDRLQDDFSEYNSKPYQEETRFALLNLCTFAYDDEVRLAARMVLDYISAHVAVSSSDLRRMVPFRRRAEGPNIAGQDGVMAINLLADAHANPSDNTNGADPIGSYFAVLAGNTRMYESTRQWLDGDSAWGINIDGPIPGDMLALEALTAYRLPTPIHDLFVNDEHRRFFQRLHRRRLPDGAGGLNADNMEIYAGSPSYLISAGGAPSGFAIDPRKMGIDWRPSSVVQQLGVALTTSFIPTGSFVQTDWGRTATNVIQFGAFAGPNAASFELDIPLVCNYGVAPDFACGHALYLPDWVHRMQEVEKPVDHGKWIFLNNSGWQGRPGFYLAIYQDNESGFGLLEAFDTWLHPDLTYFDFVGGVLSRNQGLAFSDSAVSVISSKSFEYRTTNGNRLAGEIWYLSPDPGDPEEPDSFGALVRVIEYGSDDPRDVAYASDIPDLFEDFGQGITDRFLDGTVMNSPAEAVVEITNPFLARPKITLDMSDPSNPRRTDEFGKIEQAGSNHEVWLDFDWDGPSEGDFFQPFARLDAAAAAVAEGGLIRIVPGTTTDRVRIGGAKGFRLVAPIGGVIIGARDKSEREPIAGTNTQPAPISPEGVWVQFDFPDSAKGNVPDASNRGIKGPFNTLTDAEAAASDGETIWIVPGTSYDRRNIGSGRRFTLVAPIGGVTIGANVGANVGATVGATAGAGS